MRLYKRSLPDIVKEVLARQEQYQATEAVVYAIDGDRVDLRINNSATVLRYVKVAGSLANVHVNDIVALRWKDGRPIVVLTSDGTIEGSSGLQRVFTDNFTIENSAAGLRLIVGGIDLRHLAFSPALEGHQHQFEDPFSQGGWEITEDGVIWQGETFIHPDGQIALGVGASAVKLSSADPDYRIWGGAIVP